MAHVDFLSPLHKATSRDYLARVLERPKAEAIRIAKQYGYDYWDGYEDDYGYPGYDYWPGDAYDYADLGYFPTYGYGYDFGYDYGYPYYGENRPKRRRRRSSTLTVVIQVRADGQVLVDSYREGARRRKRRRRSGR